MKAMAVIILEFLTRGPKAQQSKIPGPYSQGHETACHPPPKSVLSILGPRRTHFFVANFLRKIKLTSIRFVSFSYFLDLYDCQISFSSNLLQCDTYDKKA